MIRNLIACPVVDRTMGCGQNSCKQVWRCHQLLSGFLANVYLPRVPRQSRLLANDKGDNEIIPGAVHRSPGIYLAAEKTPGKPQERVNEDSATSHQLKWDSLSPNDAPSIPRHVRKGGGKERVNFIHYS